MTKAPLENVNQGYDSYTQETIQWPSAVSDDGVVQYTQVEVPYVTRVGY